MTMPRKKGDSPTYLCQSCGEDFPKWFGRCPSCGEWNSLTAYRAPSPGPGPGHRAARGGAPDRGLGIPGRPRRPSALTPGQTASWVAGAEGLAGEAEVQLLGEVHTDGPERIRSGIGEFDRVLGGGIVPGSVVLVGGDPGVGKSTLLLQVASQLVRAGRGVLYVSGEESAGQIRLRAQRLGVTGGLPVLAEADLERILAATGNGVYRARNASGPNGALETEEKPGPVEILIVDSIQATFLPDLPSTPGSVLQVREGALALTRTAKTRRMAVLLVGHVTKEGHIAGPRTLEHIVDAVLTMEGDPFQAHRILRSVKNRFGSVHEIGVFDMREGGLEEVANPSQLFLGEDAGRATGSVVVAGIEGTRSLLMEVQALVHPTRYGIPQRIATGFDVRRLAILLAVLVKRGGLDVTASDVFVNVAGGLRIDEPGVDLGMLLAIASSLRDQALGDDLAAFGEIGLGGEVRRAGNPERRIAEAARLGFRRIMVPAATARDLEARGWKAPEGSRLLPVATLHDALRLALGDAARAGRRSAATPRDAVARGARAAVFGDTEPPGGHPPIEGDEGVER
jgi:DNA repair protein RadA/Sms